LAAREVLGGGELAERLHGLLGRTGAGRAQRDKARQSETERDKTAGFLDLIHGKWADFRPIHG
jgi:hypothetical protein